ncbi:Calmodulin-binding transcription activator 1 [Rhynchospora pubera]|uniref:Calmodulin-binding transcription activator 1 n=1 Tax=Rhynchospora pubera TaxID=906938 RepID=A0AAV8HLF0_9POAL|nr:Calmodulin-binding transcription activator 1 [Rhynchospora pubera]
MADMRRYSVTPQLNIEQILQEAQTRWLRPAEICEILRNYKKFRIAPEPPSRPPSGSLFLFDRKVLRYFRKDNHNWRKKKDGKTVKEAHEKLKDGSVDVLHCYYAHGEENETFQRRTYWMLEEQYTHIVLVHYLEVKGGKQSYSRIRDVEGNNTSGPVGSNSYTTSLSQPPSHAEAGSPISAQTSELEDTESDNSLRARTSTPTSATAGAGHHPFLEMRQYDAGAVITNTLLNNSMSAYYQCYNGEVNPLTSNSDIYGVSQQDISRVLGEAGLGYGVTVSGSKTESELTPWDEVLEQSFSNSGYAALTPEESFTDGFNLEEIDNSGADSASALQLGDSDIGCLVRSSNHISTKVSAEESATYSALTKQSSLDLLKIEADGLKKYDSFSRWMSKELGGAIDELSAKSSSDLYWSTVAGDTDVVGESSITISNSENLDTDILSPSLSQEQLFSIIDFSPSWARVGSKTKVLITGTFLKRKEEVDKCSWSCMFGEEEVPAQILSDGTLRCYAPPHKPGPVPFYITCSNRTACSEIREFEFREPSPFRSDMETSDSSAANSINEMHLYIRLEKLLSVDPMGDFIQKPNVSELCNKITALLVDDDEWSDLLQLTDGRDQLVEKLMKERLRSWLIRKVSEEGKGPNILGQEGQGVIHLAAALGYDWAMKPIVVSGVSVNFRDVHGWTALHWAASWGRERTVVALKTLGANPGALTDPTPEFPNGRTPADLASTNGHKGIAGFLAESSLTSHLSTLTLKDSKANISSPNQICTLPGVKESSYQSESLGDSLGAVRNATQAAARIYQVFRLESFHRKRVAELDSAKDDINEGPLSLVTVKSANKMGPHEPLHAAAVRIQNKFRGWKGRKDFLFIRQRVVKIQAHVRGHQVRKRYKEIVWTIRIVGKLIRWKKGAGLRGTKSENRSLTNGPSSSSSSSSSSQNLSQPPKRDDDYDILKEGRKQTEARLQRALARVKSMVQYPEARDQYRRLMLETQAEERIMHETEEVDDDDLMAGLEDLCEDEITPIY